MESHLSKCDLAAVFVTSKAQKKQYYSGCKIINLLSLKEVIQKKREKQKQTLKGH